MSSLYQLGKCKDSLERIDRLHVVNLCCSIVNVYNPVSTDLQRQCNVYAGLNLGILIQCCCLVYIDVPTIVLLFVKFKNKYINYVYLWYLFK
jgi:hypothetical protein